MEAGHPQFGRPARGLRKRDPVSPYLFILMADVLPRQVEKEVIGKRIPWITLRRGFPESHHLFFMDDSLFFIQGLVDNARHLNDLIVKYWRSFSKE